MLHLSKYVSDTCADRPGPAHSNPSGRFRPALLSLAIATAFAALPSLAQTLPSGGVAVYGQASFTNPTSNQLVVTTQNGAGTGHSAINWQSFSISARASTRIVQPGAASLSINRVVTDTPSAIFGSLSSNGRLVLVNQSGIAIGAGALVDTAGFTASSLRMADADAIAGRLRFGAAAASGGMGGGSGITVDGVVTARNGDVVLVAPQISLGASALITAPNGSTVLAAGQQVEITGRGLEGIRLLVQARENEALNLGRLQGDAVGIFAGTLRHSGEIQATTAVLDGGKVVLKAAGALAVDGAVLATGTNGPGGQIHVTGETVTLGATALLDASGSQGGGEILVGGGWHGQDARIGNAQRTVVADGARMAANATNRGDGGSVVVWADKTTRFAGSIHAAGGEHGGDGGHVEVSGKQRLDFRGQVDLSAPHGRTGSLLLDPSSITIGSVADADGNSTQGDDVSGDIAFSDFGTAASMITAAQVSSLLNTVDLSLQATGDITVSQPINKTSGPATTLTLYAGNKLDIDAPISGASGSPLNLSLTSDGAMATTASITTFGGAVGMSAGFGTSGSLTLNGDINAGSGNVVVSAHGNVTQASGVITASTLTGSGSLGSATLNGANNVAAARLSAGGGGGVSFNNVATSYLLSGSGSNGLTVTGTGSVTVDQTVNFTSVDISANNGITLAADVTSAGSLNLTTSNSMISQSSGKITAVQTHVNAGSGDIALGSLTNDTLLVSLVGGHITMQNAGQLIVTALTSGSDKNVFLQAGGPLMLPAGDINTGAGQLSLTNGTGAMTTPGALTGSDILLNSQHGDLTLAHPVTSNGSSTLTLSSGGTLSVQAAVNGHGINMDAVTGIDILAPVHATSGLTVTSNGANTSMQVQRFVGSDGTMNLTLSGGLSVLGSSSQDAALDAGTGQSISAKFVEVLGDHDGSARILNNSGAQSITTFGVNDSGEGVRVAGSSMHPAGSAAIYNNGSTQTITVNDADYARIIGSAARAIISNRTNSVSQSLVVQGVSSQNRIELGSAGATAESFINSEPGPQSITAGLPGQSGGIVMVSGIGTSNDSVGISAAGDQTIQVGSGGIQLTGGGNNNNFAAIYNYGTTGTQTITSGGDITLNGGSSGSNNYSQFSASGSGGQSITMSGGTLTIQGGAGGSGNSASINAQSGSQSITGAPNILLNGGTGGADLMGNFASITAAASQTMVAHNLTLRAGLSGINNYAMVAAPTQDLTVHGDLTMTGGGSAKSQDDTVGGGVRIGGTPSSASNVTLNVTNSVELTGGSVDGAGAGIGSNRSSGQPATVSITAGGNVILYPGSNGTSGSHIGSTANATTGGDVSIVTASGNFIQSGSTSGEASVQTLGDVYIKAATAIIGNSVIGNTVRVVGDNGVGIHTTSAESGSITASAPSGDSIMVESGGNFLNSSGPTALTISGTSRWLVYSTDPDLDTRDGLAHGFRQFGSVPGDPILEHLNLNGFIHSISKNIAVALNTVGISKVYDGTTSAPLTAANYIVPAQIGVIEVTVALPTTGSFDNRNVGSGKTVSVSGISITSARDTEENVDIYGISVTPATLSGAIGTITPANITVSTSDVSRPYNGTTSAPGVPVVTRGSLFAPDKLTGGSYTFQSNGNVGSGKTVTVSGLTVNDGNNGANYLLTLADNNSSSITPAPLVLSSSAVTKVYDTTTSAAGTLVVNSGTLFEGDAVAGGVFAFLDKNAGTGKTVTVGQADVTDGNGGQNYAVSYVNNTISTITKASIASVSGITVADKVYDGNTDAVLNTSGAAFAGRLGSDVLAATGANAKFGDRNAGSGKPVSVSGISLGGADAINYTLLNPTFTASANITPAPLTISTTPVSKTFDGNTSAAGTAVVTAGSLVAGDTLSGGEFAFLDKNVGLNKTVTVANVDITDGNKGGNYAVTYVSNLTSSILSLGLSTWTGSADNRWTNPRQLGRRHGTRRQQCSGGANPGRHRQRVVRRLGGHDQRAEPEQPTSAQRDRWHAVGGHRPEHQRLQSEWWCGLGWRHFQRVRQFRADRRQRELCRHLDHPDQWQPVGRQPECANYHARSANRPDQPVRATDRWIAGDNVPIRGLADARRQPDGFAGCGQYGWR
ncbi:MAG: filamentous hemagglutinin N-terminal domain-containing protein [Leptospiraceae bacterium]|nr:filamentous hemagglutinin N-terminal domain-containing protein [Leptospiraceae bacterium]